jgi:N utilization substance protein B
VTQGSRSRARQAAIQALYQWQLTGQSAGEIERDFISDSDLRGVDVVYFRHLVSEVPRRQQDLDAHLGPCLDRELRDVDPVERAILRVGAFEFEFHPEIPYRVIINEAVELAKTFGAEQGHKYVNAVLDRLAARLRPNEIGRKVS